MLIEVRLCSDYSFHVGRPFSPHSHQARSPLHTHICNTIPNSSDDRQTRVHQPLHPCDRDSIRSSLIGKLVTLKSTRYENKYYAPYKPVTTQTPTQVSKKSQKRHSGWTSTALSIRFATNPKFSRKRRFWNSHESTQMMYSSAKMWWAGGDAQNLVFFLFVSF